MHIKVSQLLLVIITRDFLVEIGIPPKFSLGDIPDIFLFRRQIRHLGNDLGKPCEASNSREVRRVYNPGWVVLVKKNAKGKERPLGIVGTFFCF